MMDGNYGIYKLIEKEGTFNQEESSEYEKNDFYFLHEWTEEEFPFKTHFGRRSDSLSLHNKYLKQDR